MGVDVHETGGDHGPFGIDLAMAPSVDQTHLDDAVPLDGDIGGAWGGTRSIDNRARSDDEIK
jgi:hypothetical protein